MMKMTTSIFALLMLISTSVQGAFPSTFPSVIGEWGSNITPDADDTYDLGSATSEWKDLYVDGTANIDVLSVSGASTLVDDVSITAGGLFITDNSTTASSLSVIRGTAGGASGRGILRISDITTDATIKQASISFPNQTNAEEDHAIVYASGTTASTLYWGGGVAALNAVQEHRFYTASDDITTTGTLALTISNAQVGTFASNLNMGGGSAATAQFTIDAGPAQSALIKTADTDSFLEITAGTGAGTGGNIYIEGSGGASPHVQIRNGTTVRFESNNTGIGFFAAAPAAQTAAYTPTNDLDDRSFDADTVAVAELADVVATIITDLQSYGLFQ